MRSRYTAYATDAVAHLMATVAPESPHRREDARAWRAELEAYCGAVSFTGLEVHEARDDRVRFTARGVHEGRPIEVAEDSRFVLRDGRWLYVDGAR